MFGRKKKDDKNNFNRSKGLLTSFDKMEYFTIEERSNEMMFRLCDTILSGKPVLANLDKISTADCNYMLAFISGVVYATDGEVKQLGNKLFLFARKQEYEDGSLMQYVEDIS